VRRVSRLLLTTESKAGPGSTGTLALSRPAARTRRYDLRVVPYFVDFKLVIFGSIKVTAIKHYFAFLRQLVEFKISIRPKRDDFLWKGCQKQHDANTKKNDVFVQEFAGEIPRYWVRG
jgi:hypothetical protein